MVSAHVPNEGYSRASRDVASARRPLLMLRTALLSLMLLLLMMLVLASSPRAVHAQECPVCTMVPGVCVFTVIDLSNQQLTAINPQWFNHVNCSTYTMLRLYNNAITELPPGVFDQLTSLDWLWLYNNQLSFVPVGIFDRLTRLTSLRLETNQLTSLPQGIFDQTSLEQLRMNSNQLSLLPAHLFDQMPSLSTLSVEFNPWSCSTEPDAVVVPSIGHTGCPGNSVGQDFCASHPCAVGQYCTNVASSNRFSCRISGNSGSSSTSDILFGASIFVGVLGIMSIAFVFFRKKKSHLEGVDYTALNDTQ